MAVSSANLVSEEVGISDAYRLYRSGDKIDSCGTPAGMDHEYVRKFPCEIRNVIWWMND